MTEKIKGEKKPTQTATTVKVVMITVPYTLNSELARRLKENEFLMEKLTGVRLKIEGKSGAQLVNILSKSNPWSGQDCKRDGCLMCTRRMELQREGAKASSGGRKRP